MTPDNERGLQAVCTVTLLGVAFVVIILIDTAGRCLCCDPAVHSRCTNESCIQGYEYPVYWCSMLSYCNIIQVGIIPVNRKHCQRVHPKVESPVTKDEMINENLHPEMKIKVRMSWADPKKPIQAFWLKGISYKSRCLLCEWQLSKISCALLKQWPQHVGNTAACN